MDNEIVEVETIEELEVTIETPDESGDPSWGSHTGDCDW
jgi:hypothetical protein